MVVGALGEGNACQGCGSRGRALAGAEGVAIGAREEAQLGRRAHRRKKRHGDWAVGATVYSTHTRYGYGGEVCPTRQSTRARRRRSWNGLDTHSSLPCLLWRWAASHEVIACFLGAHIYMSTSIPRGLSHIRKSALCSICRCALLPRGIFAINGRREHDERVGRETSDVGREDARS